jgi:hypothetical protein
MPLQQFHLQAPICQVLLPASQVLLPVLQLLPHLVLHLEMVLCQPRLLLVVLLVLPASLAFLPYKWLV